jgi:alkylation response protein AidB-like acyl-CoA dehydrogenase
VLNGQKIWISTAHVADWGLFLVRTDATAIERGAKHDGITALIIDMRLPGIECRPIKDIAGDEMFNEVFFTDARGPAAYRLGEEGAGWQVAMGTLGHERVGTAGLTIGMKADLDAMVSTARSVNPAALEDPELRERIARAYTHIEYTRLLNYRALSKILKGQPNWPEVPIAKLQWSYLAQTLAELAVDLMGPAGMFAKGAPDAVDNGTWNRLFVFQRYTSIGAGTTEVQKNIIADRAIKLPRK